MLFIKRFFIKLAIIICTIIIVLCSTIFIATQGYLDTPIKKLIECSLSRNNAKIQIGNLRIRNNLISIDKIYLGVDENTRGEITNCGVTFTFDGTIRNPRIKSGIEMENISLIGQDNKIIINTTISARQMLDLFANKIEMQINLSPIKNISLLDSYGKYLPEGQGFCTYKSRISIVEKKSINCKVSFEDRSYLLFNSIVDSDSIQASGSIKNIPILIYQIAKNIAPNNPVIVFLQEYIKNGYIRDGEFDINFDKDFLKENVIPKTALRAKLHIVDLDYQYSKDFPTLKKADTNIEILGSSVQFLINQAYSGNSVASGIVTFDWQGMDNSSFIVDATSKGKIIDLIDFIPNEIYTKLKKQGIDLKQITGQADSKINIIIPILETKQNSYNISTTLNGAKGVAFNNNIVLQNANMVITFNGDRINLVGKGKINNYASDFTYKYNITSNNHDDYNGLLNVKTTIVASKQQFGILQLMSGNSILNFEYKEKKDGKSLITANSNLKNLEFYIDKIPIHKKLYNTAIFTLTSKSYGNEHKIIDFDLSGENNLKVSGKIEAKNKGYNITLPTITYDKTNINGSIFLDQNNVNAKIQGSKLDLSEYDMLQFLKKYGAAKNIRLMVDVARIRLKNDIWLNNFNLRIDCDKVKCFTGSLNSKIGTKSLTMSLIDSKDSEKWVVVCDNTGALLRGLGMYNNMKSGILNLTLNTNRTNAPIGGIIPIVDGTFDLKRFVVTDMPFMTKMVSFISFPGFLSSITNNKQVMFESMVGKFSYVGNIITVSDISAIGPFFDFTMKGTINNDSHKINLTGNVVPSIFFISKIVAKIPVIGTIFSKAAPYSVKLDY